MRRLLYIFFVVAAFFISAHTTFAAPPTNFQTTLKIGSGLTSPTGFEIAPDGRIFILQRTGEVKIYKNGQLLPDNFTVLPTIATGDRGLIGIAFDPEFLNNHFVYFYLTDTDLRNKLVRFDASGDTATNGPLILYQTTEQSFQLHVGGTVRFGPDGKIYLSIGDNGTPGNSQNLGNVHGKILRLNKDGNIPPDNPFVGRQGAKPEIWAYGLRNPFRFQFDSVTGNLYEGEVGESTWEEINLIRAGKNYGWPTCEGLCSPSNVLLTDPIYTYNHNGGSASVVGGPVYHGQMFPSTYQGRLFFGDYAMGFLKTMALDSSGNNAGVSNFDLNAGSVVDMKVDPRDGSMYYLTIFPGALYQVTYSTGVKVPIAASSSDVTSGPSPLTVHFSSNGSSDPNNLALTYNWNFGDNTTSTDPNPTKTYTANGKYIVQLTVQNGTYSALANPLSIQVGTPPNVSIDTPVGGTRYNAGDTIQYSISATDGQGGVLGDNQVATTIVFHHQTHIHPFLGPLSGKTGQFSIPTTGESSPDTWYEIIATATDSSGLTSTKSMFIFPNKSNLTLSSNVNNLKVLLDGQPTTVPITVQGVVNFVREISAPFLQVLNGVVYSFHSWSDGSPYTHTITVPQADTTLSATFDQTPPFSGQYFTNQTLSGSPALSRNDNIINFDWSTAPPSSAIPHDHYSVRWTKKQYFPSGKYTFTLSSDDGSRLYVDNALVINAWRDQPLTETKADVDLTSGDHDLRVVYYQNGGGAVISMSWAYAPNQSTQQPTPTRTPTPTPTPTPTTTPSGPTSTPTSTSTTQQRLGGMNLDGYCKSTGQSGVTLSENTWICSPSRTAIDLNKACQWQYNNQNAFAKQDVTGNPYTWTCYSTSGTPPPTATPTRTPTPTPTQTQPTPTPQAQSGYQGKYWNLATTATFPPTIPTSTPTLSRTDAAINFTWNNGSPAPQINVDRFVVQWTSTQSFTDGNYQFSTTSDDGIRVYIDGVILINQWNDHPSTTANANKTLTAGNHTLRIDYYEHAGGAISRFSFQKI